MKNGLEMGKDAETAGSGLPHDGRERERLTKGGRIRFQRGGWAYFLVGGACSRMERLRKKDSQAAESPI